jgi:hypothetical protein
MKKLKYRIIQYQNGNKDTFYRAKYLAFGFLWFYVKSQFNPDKKAQCETRECFRDNGNHTVRGILYHIKEHARQRRAMNYEIVIIEDIEV